MFNLKKLTHKRLFERWLKEHNGVLYRHALWMTGNHHTAMDMVQETFFQAWQSMHNLSDKDKALPWLIAILRRVIYREQSSQYRHKETVAELGKLELEYVENDCSEILDIYGLLESLSLAHREIFLLRNLHGFSYDEISEQLNIPVGTVMSRLARAKEKLQQIKSSQSDNVIPIKAKSSGGRNE